MFVVCGEALMDVFVANETAAGMALNAVVGGAPFNVAIGLARLGQPVGFLGAVSRDVLGERLMRALQAEGVSTVTVQRTAARTTLGLVGLDAHGVPSYSFYGDHGADRQLHSAALELVPESARVFHVGSFALVVEPIASALRALVEREHRHRLIVYDPNVRLNVEPDVERWREAVCWMAPRTHLLKAGAEDLALLYPGARLDSLAASWLSQGVALVVVTRGERGVVAWTRDARVEVPSVSMPVVDTVGAGDSLQAALLAGLAEQGCLSRAAVAAIEGPQLEALLRFAAHAAAITCSRQGADLPRRHELPAL